MRRFTLAITVALAVAFTLPHASLAAPSPSSGDWTGPAVLWESLQSWALNVWTHATKDGFTMDPDGAPSDDSGDEAQGLVDPNGAPGPETEDGFTMDPNGVSGD